MIVHHVKVGFLTLHCLHACRCCSIRGPYGASCQEEGGCKPCTRDLCSACQADEEVRLCSATGWGQQPTLAIFGTTGPHLHSLYNYCIRGTSVTKKSFTRVVSATYLSSFPANAAMSAKCNSCLRCRIC